MRADFSSLCFAMTINKSYGLSLFRVALFLLELAILSRGQFYIVVSRVTYMNYLKIFIYDKDDKICNRTKYVICIKEAFQNI